MKRKRQPAEPYRIKSVESIKLLPRHERERKISLANYNLFKLDAPDVYIDLLTDSGTGAMSAKQWAALMLGDESYAGATSFRNFESTIKDIFRKEFVVPCHQGRAAENMFFTVIDTENRYVLNNTHFDTTKGNVLHKRGFPVDLPSRDSLSPEPLKFKGNMDTAALEDFIKKHGAKEIAVVIMTVTNNSVGGQPVAMENIAEVSEICHRHGLLVFLDCARFAEDCFFIKRDEKGFGQKSIKEIAQEMFEHCDGVLMSAKKDGLANIGAFIALNDESLYRKLTELMVIIEGFPTYGGLAGRDLEIIAAGLDEVLDYDYLDFRVDQVKYFGEKLLAARMPIVEPTGGHAVFIDAGILLPHIPPEQFPGQTVAVELYREGGIRSAEIGTLMLGGIDSKTGKRYNAPRELIRLALPRRVYTNSHLDYVAEVAEKISANKENLNGYKITRESNILRHFTCDLTPLESVKVTTR
ncbi:MAG: tryptophanase [Candidatus Zixiibacteriota bacterium]